MTDKELDQQRFCFDQDGQYFYVSRTDKPGKVQIKYDEEGIAVDIFDDNDECQGSTFCLYTELDASAAEEAAWYEELNRGYAKDRL